MKRMMILFLTALMLIPTAMANNAGVWSTGSEEYYHKNSACDSGMKLPLSVEAAELFGKLPCPVCVLELKPVYTGGWSPEWTLDTEMWSFDAVSSAEELMKGREDVLERLRRDSGNTNEKFDELRASLADEEYYPDGCGGRYTNAAGGSTYLLKNPTPESIARFHDMFGGGVWILPAKYDHNELEAALAWTMQALNDLMKENSGLKSVFSSAYVDIPGNAAVISLYGEDSGRVISMLEAPACVRFEIADEMMKNPIAYKADFTV